MLKLIAKLQTRLNEDKGATAVEYGLLVTVIALVMVAGAVTLGEAIRDLFIAAAGQL